jgi:hypothetical protein
MVSVSVLGIEAGTTVDIVADITDTGAATVIAAATARRFAAVADTVAVRFVGAEVAVNYQARVY